MAPRSSTALPTGDPRRPLEAKKYKRPPPPKEEDMPPDLIGIAGALFGMGGTLLRWKPCAWLAAFCCASSLTNIKVAENDLKQVVSNVTFSLTGLLVCYLAPTTQGAAQKNLTPGPVGAVMRLFGYNQA
ncbi:PAT complex subunit Asterix [Pycnococcus provasolii]